MARFEQRITGVGRYHYVNSTTAQCLVSTAGPGFKCSAQPLLQCPASTAVPGLYCRARPLLQCPATTAVPGLYYSARPLLLYFYLFNTVDNEQNIYPWLDPNLGPLVFEATAATTVQKWCLHLACKFVNWFNAGLHTHHFVTKLGPT